MGLFSFIKNAGAKVFGKDEEKKAESPAAAAKDNAAALEIMLNRLGLSVSNLDIEFGKMITVKGNADTNATREKVILALGNVEGVGAVEDEIVVANPEPESRMHVVQKGDTLSKIAKEVYGDAMKYPVIFEANKPMLTDPNLIYPGQVLRIPPQ